MSYRAVQVCLEDVRRLVRYLPSAYTREEEWERASLKGLFDTTQEDIVEVLEELKTFLDKFFRDRADHIIDLR